MRGKPYTDEEVQLIRDLFPTHAAREVAKLMPGRTYSAIKTKANLLKIKKAKPRYKFTDADIEYIKKHYHNTLNKELASKIGCSIHSIENKGFELKLKKDKMFVIDYSRKAILNPNHGGRKHQFKKGHTPANKGMKQSEYMSPKAIERTKGTRFKKGQSPVNTKPIGYERITKDGYVEVKYENGCKPKFKLKHRVIWEQHHGKIKKGYNIQFKDGNRMNCEIGNLYMISRKDQLNQENSIHRYPENIKEAIKLNSKLLKQIRSYE